MSTNIQDDLYELIRHKSKNDSRFDLYQDLKSYAASNEHRGYTPDLITESFNNLVETGVITIKIELAELSSGGYYVQIFADISDVDKKLST